MRSRDAIPPRFCCMPTCTADWEGARPRAPRIARTRSLPVLLCVHRSKSMKLTTRYLGSRSLLCFSFVLVLISVFTVQAHDPGLSTATITVGDHQIEVLLGFAEKDVESLLTVDGKRSYTRNPEELEPMRSELESLATQDIHLILEGVTAAPNQATAKRKDNQNIEILLRFERTNAARLRLVSKLFQRLPFGHRQFASAQTTSGVNLGQAMLSGSEDSWQIDLPKLASPTTSANAGHSFFAFLKLGIEHILTGYDHLLFLFALLVVCRDLRSILTVITCFTIAHSITLALSTLDLIRLPARIVEPLIAASIAYVGIENLIRGDAPKWRWLITFSFGLVHGLGFADALKEFGIGSGQLGIVLPLVGFNLGVEFGQLSVAAVALPILWQLRKNPGFVRRWVPSCSVAVAMAGSYWMIERLMQQ
jgi:hydrogenase/urease accessory protein HupE